MSKPQSAQPLQTPMPLRTLYSGARVSVPQTRQRMRHGTEARPGSGSSGSNSFSRSWALATSGRVRRLILLAVTAQARQSARPCRMCPRRGKTSSSHRRHRHRQRLSDPGYGSRGWRSAWTISRTGLVRIAEPAGRVLPDAACGAAALAAADVGRVGCRWRRSSCSGSAREGGCRPDRAPAVPASTPAS